MAIFMDSATHKMHKYNPKIHHRRSTRLRGYDYSEVGMYFITICCQDRAHLFGEIIDGEMHLNLYGQIAHEEWLQTGIIRDNCRLHEFIIMPNHIHGIIEISFTKGNKEAIGKFQSPSQTIGSIIRGFKIATIKKIKDRILAAGELDTGELQFAPRQFAPRQFAPRQFALPEKIKSIDFRIWQRNYHDHIIRHRIAFQRISRYIKNNPANWQKDKKNKK